MLVKKKKLKKKKMNTARQNFYLPLKDDNPVTPLDFYLNKDFFNVIILPFFHQMSIFLLHSPKYLTEDVRKIKGLLTESQHNTG